MRYAVISDIHANIQALKAVLNDINGQNIDRIISLGDLVGYGPNPLEVIALLNGVLNDSILGNHDAAVVGYFPINKFNDNARASLEWTVERLGKKELDFLSHQALEITFDNARFAHSNFCNSASFHYIISPNDALASFNACEEQLLFTGHSHIPGIFVIGNSGVPHWLPPIDFQAEDEKRYIINVGSIGIPRDNDSRASYCIFDTETQNIFFRKVPFDRKSFQSNLNSKGLFSGFPFLQLPDIIDKQELQEDTDFKKPERNVAFNPLSTDESKELIGQIEELNTNIETLNRAHRRLLHFIIFIILIFLLCGGYFAFNTYGKKAFAHLQNTLLKKTSSLLTIPAEYIEIPENKRKFKYNDNIFPPIRERGEINLNKKLEYWNIRFSPATQNIKIIESTDSKHKKFPTFEITSDSMKDISIVSAYALPKKNMRFKAYAQFKALNFEDGSVLFSMEYCLPDGTWKSLLQKNVTKLKTSKRWLSASLTMSKNEPLANDYPIRASIKLRFKGKILIRKIIIQRKK